MRIIFPAVIALAVLLSSGAMPSGQTAATGRVMRDKLNYAQQALRAIMVSDHALLERASESLSRATEAEGWYVLKSPEYQRHSDAFMRSAQDLLDAARQRDLDAAALAYTSMTMRCYQCHRYLKGVRMASR
jgi:hypothetical protein